MIPANGSNEYTEKIKIKKSLFFRIDMVNGRGLVVASTSTELN